MSNKDKKLTFLIHAAIWTAVFISPLMFLNHGNGVSLRQFVYMSAAPMALMIVFYTNYLWLTPNFFAEKDKKKYYWIINIIMIVCIGIGLHCWMEATHTLFDEKPGPLMLKHKHHNDSKDYMFIFLAMRNMFNLAISATIATSVQLAMRWQASESARREAQAAHIKAELKNLRSQINPHFLLNTLNNIYALTAFDTQRAQEAIQELSKMLHHVLYDNQQSYVNLEKEVQFLTNYINLMKIRLSANVDVQMNVDIPKPCNIVIAPLIFISLVENAFKHGVSTSNPSFINITLTANDDEILCDIENSNFPKNETDRSGHGIGLKQVASRLELIYPGKYEWTKGTHNNNTKYKSTIKIYDTKLCNN